MTVPGRLTVAPDGRVTGPAWIAYNSPWPCPNGSWGSGAIQGVVMHTMVGDLAGTIAVFNDPSYQASAHFGIDQSGNIHQFGPIGKGWVAWAQVAGNGTWYSVEHADNGDPDNPLTPEQVTASAQLLECLSAFAGFPLQEANTTAQHGYGVHYMGGMSWGGHTCPDLPPRHVRSSQRPQIIELALAIRAAGTAPEYPVTEEPMLLLPQNQATPVAIPAGATILRFVAAGTATAELHFHTEAVSQQLDLSWAAGSHAVPVPPGCHAALVTRTDAGTEAVACACSA